MKQNTYIVLLLVSLESCNQHSGRVKDIRSVVAVDSCRIDFNMDTVRFQNNLTLCQARQVYYRRNFEEDYRQIEDTARVAIRFTWHRAFHGLTIIRLENRPITRLSDTTNQREVWQEWFATYKIDIQSLNSDFSVLKGNKIWGKAPPFVFQQNVQMLPANQTPSLVAAVDSIGFWKMKHEYPAGQHTDGSSWTLEVYRNGKYHEVTTDLEAHPIKTICLQLIKLSEHPATREEIY